jgi:hypothetical protein
MNESSQLRRIHKIADDISAHLFDGYPVQESTEPSEIDDDSLWDVAIDMDHIQAMIAGSTTWEATQAGVIARTELADLVESTLIEVGREEHLADVKRNLTHLKALLSQTEQ